MDNINYVEIISIIENKPYILIIPLVLVIISIIYIFKSSSKPNTSTTASDNIDSSSSKNNKNTKKKTPSPNLDSSNQINESKNINKSTSPPKSSTSPSTSTTSPIITPTNSSNYSNISEVIPLKEHKLFFKVLKGGDIINCIKFSGDGKYLSFCGGERSIKMYLFDTLVNSKIPQSFPLQLPFDNATCISWGNKTIYASLNDSQKLVSFNILDNKNALGKSYENGFSVNLDQKSKITSICSSVESPYILTCSQEDTIVKVWTLKGQLIQSINTGQIKHYMGVMSQCGRFFAIASFSSEVKIYEAFKKKDGSLDQCKRVMSLTGYKTCIYSISFSSDGLKVLTSSKDGGIRLWSLNVNYKLEVDPENIYSVTSEIGPIESLLISPDNSVFVGINQQNVIGFFNLSNGVLLDTINCSTNEKINSFAWSPDSKYLVTGSNDKLIYIWSNPKKL